MADPDHLKMLRQGVDAWNAWRKPDITPNLGRARVIGPSLGRARVIELSLSGADLSGANLSVPDLSRADLSEANLSGADLSWADLSGANLIGANLIGADLSGAYFIGADLSGANLSGANLSRASLFKATLRGADLSGAYFIWADLSGANLIEANLSGANLYEANLSEADLGEANLSGVDLMAANLFWANLSGANLSRANLSGASLLNADITNADLTGCRIFGVSAWRLKLSDQTKQRNLIITRKDESEITVDNIEVAQFIYLLLNNQKIREILDTITSKAVLILGRFTDERKAVLDALRDELRKRNYLPILFDFDKPTSQTTDETITLLARMARFMIADISDAKSVLQELRAIVPEVHVPVQPVIIASQDEPGMFDFYRHFPWFLPVHRYDTPAQLLSELGERVIEPSEAKVLEFRAT